MTKLNDTLVATLEYGNHHDGGGLYLQVSKTLSRSFVYRYYLPGIKTQQSVGLGTAGDIAIDEFWQPAPGGRLEIVERKVAFQGARHRASGAGHRGRRGRYI